MSSIRDLAVAAAALCASTFAHAGVISFTFSPPANGGTLTSIAGAGAPDAGLMVFDQATALNFSIDATSEGLGIINFPNARMFMTMTLPPATDLGGGFYRSNVSGTFSIYDYTGNVRNDIITGNVGGGQFLVFGTAHLIQLSSNTGLSYTSGPRLDSILGPNRHIAASQDGTFALSDVHTAAGSPNIIGAGNIFETFFAHTAFSGSTNVISVPTPGCIALLSAGGFVMARRRR